MFSNGKSFDRLILLLIVTVQAFLFRSFYHREIAWYPPQGFDQTVFLKEAYLLQEHIFSNGLSEFWKAVCANGHFSGIALPIEGTLLSLIFGQGRFPPLLVNLVSFAILQVVAFYTARTVWRNRAYGYLALGLILCQITPWFWAGGLFDFRMDFIAYCLFGVWVCAVLRSSLFMSIRWAFATGLIAAFLVLHRFLTVVYLFGVSVGFAAICVAIAFLLRRDTDLVVRFKQRLFNIGLSLATLLIVATPILLNNWKAICDYYVAGHVVSNEKNIRAAQVGIHDLAGHLFFYPRSILADHLGSIFLWASALAVAGGVASRLLDRSRENEPFAQDGERALLEPIFLLCSIIVPIVILTADIAKSPIVGGIVGGPVALLTTVLVVRLAANGANRHSLGRKLVFVCSLLVLALGLLNQFGRATRHLPQYARRSDLQRFAALDEWLVTYASEKGWQHPKISVDLISDFLLAPAITVSGYEQTRKLVAFEPKLGGATIMGVDKSEALRLIATSDFVILTDAPKIGVYPFYERIAQYWQDLKVWANSNLIAARTVRFDSYGFTATVYVRPAARLVSFSGDWVTAQGLLLEATRSSLKQYPVIQLSGSANYSWLPRIPTVSATIDPDGLPMPASFRRVGNSYKILVDTSSLVLPDTEQIIVKLNFDTFFVPKQLGLNQDSRQLVVKAPEKIELVKSAQ